MGGSKKNNKKMERGPTFFLEGGPAFVITTRKYAYLRISCVFWVWALPKVQDRIRKQFFDKLLYKHCSKKIVECFVQKKLRSKKWISYCIFKK